MTSILITGASGFLGKRLVERFSELGFIIYALDVVPHPNSNRVANLPNVFFINADISDKAKLQKIFANKKVDFLIHLAAFWSFKSGFSEIYQRVNIQGTQNIIDLAQQLNAQRLIFASSITAVILPKQATMTEFAQPDPNTKHPYGWSKARCEILIKKHYDNLPSEKNGSAAIVRLTGVFDDWCELPPLAAAIRRWSVPGPVGRIIPGSGQTGFGYLHTRDFTQFMLQVIKRHQRLNKVETLLACPEGATTHEELYPSIRQGFGLRGGPIFMPLSIVRRAFQVEKWLRNKLPVNDCIEEDWMFDEVDNVKRADPSYTFAKTQWQPSPELHITRKLPEVVTNAKSNWRKWNSLQDRRMQSPYLRFQQENQLKQQRQFSTASSKQVCSTLQRFTLFSRSRYRRILRVSSIRGALQSLKRIVK